MLSTLVSVPTGKSPCCLSNATTPERRQKETKSGVLWFDVRLWLEMPTCLPGRLRPGRDFRFPAGAFGNLTGDLSPL